MSRDWKFQTRFPGCGEIENFRKPFPGVERLNVSKKHFPGVERLNISRKTFLGCKEWIKKTHEFSQWRDWIFQTKQNFWVWGDWKFQIIFPGVERLNIFKKTFLGCREIENFIKVFFGCKKIENFRKLTATLDPLNFSQIFHLWVFTARLRRKHGLRRNAAKKKRWDNYFKIFRFLKIKFSRHQILKILKISISMRIQKITQNCSIRAKAGKTPMHTESFWKSNHRKSWFFDLIFFQLMKKFILFFAWNPA